MKFGFGPVVSAKTFEELFPPPIEAPYEIWL